MSAGEDRRRSALEGALRPPWVAHPDLGVMVIEVKGGRVGRIGGQWESVDRNGQGLEAPVMVLCELDGRVKEEELGPLLYVGSTRARAHLVVVCSDEMVPRIGKFC